MKSYLLNDTIETMREIIKAITFNTYDTTDLAGTATSITVAVQTHPFKEDEKLAGVYIRPIESVRPVHNIGDTQRKVDEHFWLYCQSPKKATTSDIVNSLVVGLDTLRSQASRAGDPNQAEIAYIDVYDEEDVTMSISDPNKPPQKYVKIVKVRIFYWVSLP